MKNRLTLQDVVTASKKLKKAKGGEMVPKNRGLKVGGFFTPSSTHSSILYFTNVPYIVKTLKICLYHEDTTVL